MRIARVRLESMATPVLAFVCDGAVYDVAELEARSSAPAWGSTDFHTRVIGLSCAGLEPLYEQLRAGERPTEARLPPGTFLPLAPCDTERASYIQLGPYDRAAPTPRFRHQPARALTGDGQPISFPAEAPTPDFEAGVAAVLRDDLWRAAAGEAGRAVLGYTLVLDWSAWREEPWHGRPAWLDAPSQLGPAVVTRDEFPRLAELRARVRVGTDEWNAGLVGDWPFEVAEAIAFISQHVELRAGDVIGVGRFRLGSAGSVGRTLRYNQRVTVSVEGLGELMGWAVRGPAPGAWRL